ncbi:ricin-type beta-trefoil lectin domain protein [Flavivirga aquimarina]|uniref:Ricin-type beta-trefoil lectin domain protein n=1 Tax=Flavivirga aquimarina TaxID=2027862 RepID=A0ABT8WFL5_9FLAO|nr:ricin-type beta-trefoil lectin domain protein [Flavivirga aquimarina]MDO5971801.1 ricin-type beta-trefoil lectin domain protein [Flavivirga aquimarina]
MKKNIILFLLKEYSKIFLTLLLFVSANSFAQTTVNSLAALKPYLNDNNVNVKLAPGTYTISATDISNGSWGYTVSQMDWTRTVMLIEGSNSTYDFTGVTINFNTNVLQAFGNYVVHQFQITGNNTVVKNLKMVDVGNTRPTRSATDIVIDGSDNTVEGFHMTIQGSYPYGYGDAFGKGGSNTIIGHKKHSALLIRGLDNTVKNCTLIHRSYGHGIFMQAAVNPTIEGCYVEGEVRTTDNMLAENSGPAYDVNFMTTWGYRLPAGYMMSLQEEGIRAYNAGETIINGTFYSRGTSNVTIKNCTVKRMRGGVTITHASGTKNVSGTTVIECERGFAVGTSATVTNCSGDAKYGPVLGFDYNNDKNSNINITLLPSTSGAYNGSRMIAYIGGSGHNITLNSTETGINTLYRVRVAGTNTVVRSTNSLIASNIDIDNYSHYPLVLNSGSSSISGISCGAITNSGSSNSVTRNTGICPGGTASPNFRLVKRNATGFAMDGGSGGANGQSIELYTNINHNNLTWTEIDRGNGYYSYQKYGTNYCIDGGNGGANGQDVYLWTCSDNNQNQHWQKINAGNGHYRLQKRNASGYSIDGGGGGAINQNVYLWSSNSNNQNQQWRFDTVASSSKTANEKLLSQEDENDQRSNVGIYPNPTSSSLTIVTPASKFNNYTIFDISGRANIKGLIPSGAKESSLDISRLSKGVYIMSLNGNHITKTFKLVKN